MATTAKPTESTTVDLLSGLTGPLPTHGDPYLTALAAVQELKTRISTAKHFLDVAPEAAPVVAVLEAQLDQWKARLTRATHDREAGQAQSGRMRRGTVSVLDRAIRPGTLYAVRGRVWVARQVRTRGTRRLSAGRPRTRAIARASSRGGDSGDDDPGESEPPPLGGFPLSFVDRAPLFWRARACRCRHLEIREGVVG